MPKTSRRSGDVETLVHEVATRPSEASDCSQLNIPSAELQPLVDEQAPAPVRVAFERRNRDLDPQLVWRGRVLA